MIRGSKKDDFARTAVRIGRQTEIALAALDLTLAQYRVMYHVAEGIGESSTLAVQIAVTPPSISFVVEGLVQRKLVVRKQIPGDRRKVLLGLTAKGGKLLERADAEIEDRISALAQEINNDRYADRAINGLRIWREIFEAYRENNHRKAELDSSESAS